MDLKPLHHRERHQKKINPERREWRNGSREGRREGRKGKTDKKKNMMLRDSVDRQEPAQAENV